MISSELATVRNFSLAGLAVLAALSFACGPKYPNCKNDSNCHQGEFCVNGTCQQCRDDSHCAAGQVCNAGRCESVPGYCDSSHPCPNGQECQASRCVAVASAPTECDAERPCNAGSRCVEGNCIADGSGPQVCGIQPIYFDFDSDALDASDRSALSTGAQCAREHNIAELHTTGSADERGTEEYNMALSERRAQAVVRYLQSVGVGTTRLTASGMGEEAATGTDEASFAHDRRVDVYER